MLTMISKTLLQIPSKLAIFNSPTYVFILACLMGFFVTGGGRMCLPVLFKDIASDLNLSLVELGTIWGLDPLAGVFISIPGGMLVDRFGVKRSAFAICMLGGIFCGLRGLATNFGQMAFITFLFGFSAAMTVNVVPKITAIWFRAQHVGLANAVFMVSIYAGQMTATMFSATVFAPLLGGWRNLLFVLAVPAIVLGILWLTTGDRPKSVQQQPSRSEDATLWQLLSHVIRIREVWIMGLVIMSAMGSITAVNGYLPLYLQGQGWSVAESGGALTLMLAVSLVGSIPVIFLSNRLRSLKPMFIVSMLTMGLSLGMLLILNGPSAWLTLAICGLVRSVPPVLVNVFIIEMPEIGSKYTGTAVGLTNTVGMVGGFLIPPLGNALAVIDPGFPILFWAIIPALFIIPVLFVKDRPRPSKTPGK
jgi:MFS transporter, NNP family, nitrate/nitrite transporter